MDDSRGFRSLVSFVYGPGPALVASGGEEGLESQKMVCALDEPYDSGLLKPHLLQEHLPVVVVLHLGNVGLCAGGNHQNLRSLVLHGLTHGVHVGIAADCGSIVHIADIHHRLIGEQEEVSREGSLFVIDKLDAAAGLALKQGLAIAGEQRSKLCSFLVSRLAGLLALSKTGLYSLQVLYLEFSVHHLLVPYRVHAAVHMDNVAVIEAAQHVQDGIALAYVCQELVSEAFAVACALDQAGDVHNVHSRRDGALRLADLAEHLEALVRDIGRAEIRFYSAEWEIGALRLS